MVKKLKNMILFLIINYSYLELYNHILNLTLKNTFMENCKFP